MKASSKRANHLIGLLLVLAGLIGWLVLPGLPLGKAFMSSSAGKAKLSMQSGSGLDAAREIELRKLWEQLKAGSPFAEEEADILRKFAAGLQISELAADTVISRALYDYYILGKELTKEQDDLLGRYSLVVAHRDKDIADLKTSLLKRRQAAEAAAGPRAPQVAPPNDTCPTAEVIPGGGPFPACSSVVDITDATTAGDPPLPSCQTSVSRSVWYRFAPTTTADYLVTVCMADGSATTVDDTVMAIYTSSGGSACGTFTEIPSNGLSDGCDDDTCASETLQSSITTRLNAGTTYFVVVWQFGTSAPTPGNSSVQLCVKQNLVPANDTCASPTTLMTGRPLAGSTISATNDYQLSGGACFTGVGQTPSAAIGRDVVYTYTAPIAANFSFRVSGFDLTSNMVLYVASSCPAATPGTPVTVATCLGAANRNSNLPAEEVFCLPLTAGQQVFVFVDENGVTGGTNFNIEVTQCTSETEANNTPATANTFLFGMEGSITPAGDVDFLSLGTQATGARVFALIDGAAGNSTDFDLRVTTTTDTLEFDDSNNDTLFGGLAPNVAGTPTTGTSTFLRVSHASNISQPYRAYAVVQPAGANPLNSCTSLTTSATDESEPNDTTATGDIAANNYFEGALASLSDLDVFCFSAAAGDTVFLSLDLDPCRDGSAFNGKLELLDSGGNVLMTVDDSAAVSTGNGVPTPGNLAATSPASPGEGLVFKISTAGTYYARVSAGGSLPSTFGDYLLSISRNGFVGPTAIKLVSFTATAYNNAVLVQWKTGWEVDNLGFRIHREENGRRNKLTPQFIAGSALLAGPGTNLRAGYGYEWTDTKSLQGQPVRYYLEEVDLNGQSTWHGPINVSSTVGKKLAKERKSVTLNNLGVQADSGEASTHPIERKEQAPEVSAAALQAQFAIASGRAVKLAVRQEGLHKVSAQELFAAGLETAANPANLQMYVDGQEIPIGVIGGGDGRLDSTDSVEFYGVGLDTVSTLHRTYWLVAGAQAGKRFRTAPESPGPVAQGSFPYTVEMKERTIYFSSLRNGDAENFFGAVVVGEAIDQFVTVSNIDEAATTQATLEIALQGVTNIQHRLKIYLNGTPAGNADFFGQAASVLRMPVAQAMLKDGLNHVKLSVQGGPSDVSLVQHIRVTYQHKYTADNNALRLTLGGRQQVSVNGFTNSAIRVMDVTNLSDPQEVTASVQPQASGFAVSFNVPDLGQRTIVAFTANQTKQPASITANQPSNWGKSANGADLLVITRPEFVSSLNVLKAHRQSQGMSVTIVDVEDVYDEFSFGQKTPQALKDFLQFAKTTWKKAPRFVMLAGDSSFDANNYLGFGNNDLVPTRLTDTTFMETGCDDCLVDFNNDGLPELPLGRLPVRTAQQAARMVDKIVRYDRSTPSESMILAADSNDGYDFETANAGLVGLISGGLKVVQVYRSAGDAAARSELLAELNRGPKILNYLGHGSLNLWRGDLLTTDDAASLINHDNLSFFVMMTCLNGYFQDATVDSMAEAFMKAPAGSVAVWASSGMCLPDDQSAMNQELYRILFSGEPVTLGQAVMRAKAIVNDIDVRRTWILFGDPTMKLK